MDLVVQIGLAVLALATLVLAFLSAKQWHWAHVLVVAGLFFGSVGYLFLLTQAFVPRNKWQKAARDAAERLEETQRVVGALQRGVDGEDNPQLVRNLENRGVELRDGSRDVESVRVLEHRLRLGNRLRGRAWSDARPQGVNQQTGEVRVAIEEPTPLGLEEGSLLFVFEEGAPTPNDPASGPQYLGEFRVVAVGEQEATLAPVQTFDEREAGRLTRSRGPWTLHEVMPVDNPSVFSGLAEEDLRALIPGGFVEEYLREGTPWTADDGEETKEGYDTDDQIVGPNDWDAAVRFVYRRQLRDYAVSFQELSRERVELLADIQAVTEQNNKLNEALESAGKLKQFHESTQASLKSDLAGVERDRKAIESHLAALRRQIGRAETLLSQTLAANSLLVSEVARIQEAAAGRDLQARPVPSRGAVDVDAL